MVFLHLGMVMIIACFHWSEKYPAYKQPLEIWLIHRIALLGANFNAMLLTDLAPKDLRPGMRLMIFWIISGVMSKSRLFIAASKIFF